MASHNTTGTSGENLAIAWLMAKGYEILHRNWRYSRFEIDIIAKKNSWLHIIEVKTLNSTTYGNPEDSVTKKKFKKLQRAADQFLFMNPHYPWLQYDILAITLRGDDDPEFFLLEDVFY